MPPAHGRAEQRSKGELADDKWFGHGHILHTIQAVNGQIISEVFAGVVEPEKNEISRRRVIYYLLLSISVRGAAALPLFFSAFQKHALQKSRLFRFLYYKYTINILYYNILRAKIFAKTTVFHTF